jgi:hypothetical protein
MCFGHGDGSIVQKVKLLIPFVRFDVLAVWKEGGRTLAIVESEGQKPACCDFGPDALPKVVEITKAVKERVVLKKMNASNIFTMRGGEEPA